MEHFSVNHALIKSFMILRSSSVPIALILHLISMVKLAQLVS